MTHQAWNSLLLLLKKGRKRKTCCFKQLNLKVLTRLRLKNVSKLPKNRPLTRRNSLIS